MNNYRELIVWKKAVEFAVIVYKETETFPKSEIYGITSQLRRAAASVAANIAEGAGRNSNKEFVHFLSIALGSIFETETFIYISKEIGYIPLEKADELIKVSSEINKMIRALQNTKNNQS
jgi:four helix bundle protein